MSKKAAVIYATHGGNAELVAEALADGLIESKVEVDCLRSEQTKATDLLSYDFVVLICSTYDVGHLNDKMIRLNNELRSSGDTFKGKQIEIIGLGDLEHYDIFCGAADILEETVKLIGAVQKTDTVRFSGYPYEKLIEFKKWGMELSKLWKD
ncbi:MAG: flavodoxin family protein [Candidatus Dojkabacteria bacterium]